MRLYFDYVVSDEIFEGAMNTESMSDEGLSSATLSDQENNNTKPKLRRRKVMRFA